MNKENIFLKIINKTIKDNSYLGDDCAYIKDINALVSVDTLVEGVHFLTSYYTPYELSKKAIIVNISDILAAGGIPKFILISLSGNLNENFIKEFYEGANEICEKYNIKIIGGDLTASDKITVCVTIIGFNRGNVPSLKNAKSGYSVYLKGFHGSSGKGLNLLLDGNRDKKNEFIKAHIEPELYPETSKFISENIKHPYVMTDTSDGLYVALDKIKNASNVGFNIDYEKIPKRIDDKNLVLYGGEDFGLLICIPFEYDSKIKEMKDFKKIGTVINDTKIFLDGIIITEDKSFEHFKERTT